MTEMESVQRGASLCGLRDAPSTDAAQVRRSPADVIRSVQTAASPSVDGLRLGDDVLLLIVHDGSGRLIDLSGQVQAVTASGAAMLEVALQSGRDVACQTLAARYRVDAAVIRADMERLFASLERQRMLVRGVVTRTALRSTLVWLFFPLLCMAARRPERRPQAKATLLMIWAFLATRLCGWADAVRVWDRAGDKLQRRSAEAARPDSLDIIDAAVLKAIARHPLTVNCKERALTAWLLMRAAGLPARLHLGVDLFPFGLHCWCAHGDAIIADRYEGRCDRYTPIVTYGPGS